jgi:cytochrome c
MIMNVRNTLASMLTLALLAAAYGCGNGGGASSTAPPEAPANDTAAATAATSGDKALDMIGASDCTTCHRLHQAAAGSPIGPAYDKVAAKYSPAADTTITRLVKKIIAGGTGMWGITPMTPHPALKEADVRQMVQYILSLKQ